MDENRNKLNEFFKQNFHHHPYLQQNEFFKRYDRYTKLLKAYLEELQEKDNGYFDNDLILEKLGEIYEGRVGEDFNEDEYKAIFTEGKKRYAEKLLQDIKTIPLTKELQGIDIYMAILLFGSRL